MPTRKTRPEAPSVVGYVAAKSLSGHRLVVVEPSGQVDYASRLDLTHPGRLVGLTLNAAVKGDSISVQRSGQVTEPSWDWQTSKPLWLDINGQITQTCPKRGFIVVVGVAIAPNSILLANIQASSVTYLLNG